MSEMVVANSNNKPLRKRWPKNEYEAQFDGAKEMLTVLEQKLQIAKTFVL